MLFGGGQERGFRPGTENTGMIAGLGEAAQLVVDHLETYSTHMREVLIAPYHTTLHHYSLLHAISIPHHSTPFHTIPYDTIPYFTISYHTFHTTSHLHHTIIPYYTTVYYHAIPYYTITPLPFHTIPHHNTHYTIPSPSYHTIPYQIIPFHTRTMFGIY